MLYVNECFFSGQIVYDPVIRITNTGKKVATFVLDIDYSTRKMADKTCVDIVAWEKNADLVEKYCKKGMGVFVKAHAQKHQWETLEETKIKMVFVADKVLFSEAKDKRDQIEIDTKGDDIPF